ncbi:hypothetical protein D3C81_1876230 [compost metagenome]
MSSCTEGHPGVKLDNALFRCLRLILLPSWLDSQALRYTQGLEILLPVIRPVIFMDIFNFIFELTSIDAKVLQLFNSGLDFL